MIGSPSWAELKAAASTTPKKIHLELQQMPYTGAQYSKFVSLVERGIEYSIVKMVAAKNIITRDQTEDQLTYMLAAPLLGMGLDISHTTNQGGHCDIVVQGIDNMLWLGEAKKYTDYGKLMGGHQQLVDRYASGLNSQLCGGIIIYTFGTEVASMMQNWRAYLEAARKGLLSEDIQDRPLQFRSIEQHRATQQKFSVRHFAIPLFHAPTDSSPPPPRPKAA